MSTTAVKSRPPKSRPLLSREAANFVRKRRIGSQQTIDTIQTNRQEQQEGQHKLNQQELLREVALTYQSIDNYSLNLLKNKADRDSHHWLRMKEDSIQRMNHEIGELEDEIARLKEIYNRPKAFSPANQYTQLHLKEFTLADELAKQRKHLELHICQHQKLKMKAGELHRVIKQFLPKYVQSVEKKGLKPLSYGDFRKKVMMERKQNEIKNRMRSISSRSSNRSRSTSIRSIISGKSSQELQPNKKNMWHLQRRKSIGTRARITTKKKYEKQRSELHEQLLFLREENGNLNINIDQLTKQIANLEAAIPPSSLTFSRKLSKQNL